MIKRERKIMEIKTITSVSLKSDKPYRNKYGTDLWAFDIAFNDGSTKPKMVLPSGVLKCPRK